MPMHKIEISQPPKTVLNSDVAFTVYSGGRMLGELRISRGSIDWRRSRNQKARRIPWERFADAMENL